MDLKKTKKPSASMIFRHCRFLQILDCGDMVLEYNMDVDGGLLEVYGNSVILTHEGVNHAEPVVRTTRNFVITSSGKKFPRLYVAPKFKESGKKKSREHSYKAFSLK